MTIAEKVTRAKADYDEVYDKAKKAFGVTEKTSGIGAVVSEHVNSEQHKVKTLVESKNLFDVSKGYFDFYDAEGTLLSSSPEEPDEYEYFEPNTNNGFGITYCMLAMDVVAGETYTISFDEYANTTVTNNLLFACSYVDRYYAGDCFIVQMTQAAPDSFVHFSKTFTIPDGETKLYLYSHTGRQFKNFQIERGTTVTDYSAYVEPSGVNITACGVNMFDVSKAKRTHFYNSIYEDGVIVTEEHISTAPDVPDEYDFFRSDNFSSSGHFYEMNVIPGKTYIWSFDVYSNAPTSNVMYAICTSTSWNYNYQLVYSLGRTDYMKVWSHVVRTVTIPDGITKIYIMSEGQRFKNMQFELASSASDYEEYKGASYTPTSDGTLEIDSISPTMTVYSDNPDVRIECEYYQDGAAVKEELTNTIISLGGTI